MTPNEKEIQSEEDGPSVQDFKVKIHYWIDRPTNADPIMDSWTERVKYDIIFQVEKLRFFIKVSNFMIKCQRLS